MPLDPTSEGMGVTLGIVYASCSQWAALSWRLPTNSGIFDQWLICLLFSSFQGDSGSRIETVLCEVAAGGEWGDSQQDGFKGLVKEHPINVCGTVKPPGLYTWRKKRK